MDIRIKTRSGVITRDLEEYAVKKVAKLDKLSPRIQSIVVNLEENASKKKDKNHKVEIVLFSPGQTLKSEEEKDTFYGALDAAVEKLKGQLKKVKTRKLDKARETAKVVRVAATNGSAIVGNEEPALGDEPRPIVHETYSARPVAVGDVVKDLNGDRRFSVFVNEQGQVNAIYLRDDGGYLLITPDA